MTGGDGDRDPDIVQIVLEFERPVTRGDLERRFCELLETVSDEPDIHEITSGFDVRHIPTEGGARKHSFEPLESGSWLRVEKEWTASGWRDVGAEVVKDVAVETEGGVIGPQ